MIDQRPSKNAAMLYSHWVHFGAFWRTGKQPKSSKICPENSRSFIPRWQAAQFHSARFPKTPFQKPLNTVAIYAKRLYLFFGMVIFHISLGRFCFTCFLSWVFLLSCAPCISPVRPLQFRVLHFSVVSSIGRF